MRRAALLALACATAALGIPAAAIAGPSTPRSPGSPTAVDAPKLTLISQPVAVAPDGSFPAFIGVDDAPDATELAVYIYDKAEPGDIVGAEPTDDPTATFPLVDLPAPAADGSRNAYFSIELFGDGQPNPDPAWGWEIDEPGVYPVRVLLLDAEGNRQATLMTSIIRLPSDDQEVTATGAALVVPIHRPPPADPDERAASDTADESLLDELDPVIAALQSHPDLPATFSATPDTVARIAGDADAATELDRLRTELAQTGRTVLDAPYVDLDASSLVQAGIGDLLTPERDLGRRALRDLLEEPVVGTWQLQDRVDTATLEQLRQRGIARTLLPNDALAGGAGVQSPVDLPAGGGTVRAAAVSGLYALGLQAADDPVLSAHRLLARLAAAGPSPTGTTNVVVTIDPATVAPESLTILADALSVGTSFFQAATIDDVLDAPVATAGPILATPADVPLGTYPDDLTRSQTSLASYESMVGGVSATTRSYAMTLAISAASDLPLDERVHDARSVDVDLQVPFNSVSMPAKDKVTLGARDATFPLTIESDLEEDVNVVIELTANDRIDLPNNRIEETLHEGRNRVKIRVRTRTSGDTPLRVTVRTPDDGVTLAESQYTVRSTAVSGVGIVLTAGAAIFLALWWGRHWYRHRHTARHARHRTRRHRSEDDLPAEPASDATDQEHDAVV